jgi:hypothetical protein
VTAVLDYHFGQPASPSAPACWAWDKACWICLDVPQPCDHHLPLWRLWIFHAGSCGICGLETEAGGLYHDHDHRTGLLRGLLCRSCNTIEGQAGGWLLPRFIAWRELPSAALLDIEIYYADLPALKAEIATLRDERRQLASVQIGEHS